MLEIMLHALVPIVFGIALGWIAGRLGILDADRIRVISVYIVKVALPIALFVGTFSFKPNQLENGSYLLTLMIALLVPWLIGLGVGFKAFRYQPAAAGILALNCAFPDMAYFGVPVVGVVLGAGGLLPVVVGNIIVSVLVVPMTMVLLTRGAGPAGGGLRAAFGEVKTAVTQPLVWAPLLGAIMVMTGCTLPELATSSLELMAKTAGGTALFALGVMLSGLTFRFNREVALVLIMKNFLMPALALGMACVLGLSGDLAKGAVLVVACPCATANAMFASTYRACEESTTAAVLASTLAAIPTMALWIYVVETIWGMTRGG